MTYIQLGYSLSAAAVAAGFVSGYPVITALGLGLLAVTVWEAGNER